MKEGLKEGILQGSAQERERSLQEKLRSVAKLAALKMPVEQIAEILGLDIELVRREITGPQRQPRFDLMVRSIGQIRIRPACSWPDRERHTHARIASGRHTLC